MPRYTEYQEEQIVNMLEDCDFERVRPAGARETVMERRIEGYPDRRLRVYTSAVAGQTARDVGKDAARVLVFQRDEKGAWRPAWKATRVHRTERFLSNLKQRCRLAWKVATSRCPKCGAMMVPRRKKGEKKDTFWGCKQFPTCRATKNM